MDKDISTPLHPWTHKVKDLSELLKTDLHDGLTDAQASKRLVHFGANIFSEEKRVTPLAIFIRQFNNPLIVVLGIAVALTITLSEWVDAGIILFAILVNAALGFFQENKAERAITNLRSYIFERTRVLRDGGETEIDSELLVPGDIIHLVHGTRITADARIISVTNFSVDESILTGESLSVYKQTEETIETTPLAERKNMVYAGTLVSEGSAFAIVTATGLNTEIGKLAKLVAEATNEKTPLQIAIGKLAWVIIAAISVIVVIIFVMGIQQNQPLYEMLLLSIAIIVGAVPEALPIGLTAVLAIGVERIAKQRGIMRSLAAAETLGSTTLILTDKTGTLTQARMQLVDITLQDKLIGGNFASDATRTRYSEIEKELLKLAACNCDVLIKNEEAPPLEWELAGAALETNIIRTAALHDIRLSRTDKESIHLRIPFNSLNKFSVAKIPADYLPGAYNKYADPHVVVGAPDILLARANMDKETYLKALASISELSENGRRVIGVALLTPHNGDQALKADHVQNITFLGVISFYDPIREEVPEALARIESHGVKVVMVTGDLPGTATAIAKSIGWQLSNTSVLTGQQIHQLSDEELLEALPQIKIIARVTPEDKLRIVRLYQKLGEIVAMTGDGVNDAPALKAASIGVALGSGSDVAKSIADLVLLDDNFNTIVTTIEEGKRMLANIKKIFVYLMSNSLDEAILIGGSIVAGIAMPLSAIQIIWVNLFTGSIPAIAFAFERQPLEHGNKVFFDTTVKFLTIGVGTLSSLLLFALYYLLLTFEVSLDTARSVLFACFSSYILVIAFSFRNLHKPIYTYNFFTNKPLIFGTILGLLLLLATIYLPILQSIFATTAISGSWLMFVVAWTLFNVLLVEGAKFILRVYLKGRTKD